MTVIHLIHHEFYFVKKILEYMELEEETIASIPAFRNWNPELLTETLMKVLTVLQIQEDGIKKHKELERTFENLEDGNFSLNLAKKRSMKNETQ